MLIHVEVTIGRARLWLCAHAMAELPLQAGVEISTDSSRNPVASSFLQVGLGRHLINYLHLVWVGFKTLVNDVP